MTLGECKKLLVVDDEPKIAQAIAAFLQSRGFAVLEADSGARALELFAREDVALVVLDLMLPDMSGEDVCRAIRQTSRTPIIMLTAQADESSLLRGLGLGADDYMTKPFSLMELHARIEAVLRRASTPPARCAWGELVVDLERDVVMKKRQAVSLTPSERRILAAFVQHPGKVFTRAELIDIAFGGEFDGYDRAVDTHIKNIRQKIEDNPRAPAYILTVHGLGYKFGK